MSTSLYQILYCCNRRGGQNIDCSSHCQITNVSKQKPFVFCFVPFVFCFVLFFLIQFFVRSKTNVLILSLFLFQTHDFCQNRVVVSLFRLLTYRSKQFCGLTLFGAKKNFLPLVLVSCLSLLLGMGGVVFLDAWCVRTRGRTGWQAISGGRC